MCQETILHNANFLSGLPNRSPRILCTHFRHPAALLFLSYDLFFVGASAREPRQMTAEAGVNAANSLPWSCVARGGVRPCVAVRSSCATRPCSSSPKNMRGLRRPRELPTGDHARSCYRACGHVSFGRCLRARLRWLHELGSAVALHGGMRAPTGVCTSECPREASSGSAHRIPRRRWKRSPPPPTWHQ